MEWRLGDTIRRLRVARGLTQEELAGSLYVSFQTVSKWERGETLPDTAMLPGLALFFDVSADELLGLETLRGGTPLREVFPRAHELAAAGRYADAAALLREGVRVFPHHEGLCSELAAALALIGGEEALAEAASLCERLLENGVNEVVRGKVRAVLCDIYRQTGRRDQAVALARTAPHIWESREVLLADAEEPETVRYALQTALGAVYERWEGRRDTPMLGVREGDARERWNALSGALEI